jgi:hypothetical protein
LAEIQREEREEVGEGMYGMYDTIRYNTEVYLPSFPPVSVNDIPKKYRLIPNQNTDSGCNSTPELHRLPHLGGCYLIYIPLLLWEG